MITLVPVRLKDAFNLDINNLDCLYHGKLQGREGETECLCAGGLVGVRVVMVAKDTLDLGTPCHLILLSVLFSEKGCVCGGECCVNVCVCVSDYEWCVYVRERVLISQLCPTLCDPTDCSSSDHGIL